MTRRWSGVFLLAAVFLAAFSGCARRKDDIVLIAVDSFRADRLGHSSGQQPFAPALDSLAARGTAFTEARTPFPTLKEAASALLAVGAAGPSLAASLARRGYYTAAAVASIEIARGSGVEAGFAAFDDSMSAVYPVVDPSYSEMQDVLSGRERRTDQTVRAALRLVSSAPVKRPLFLFVHLADPEQPYDPPLPFASEHASSPYDGEISFVDEGARLLVNAVEQVRGHKPLVVFVGLYGEGLGAHGEMTHGFFLYDSTLRVPLIFCGPGVPAGRTVPEPVSLVDVAPTIASFAGTSVGRGRDLKPSLRGGKLAPAPLIASTFYAKRTHGWGALAAVMDGGWKLIRAPRPELYNVAEDPSESRNRFGEEAQTAQRLMALLERSGPSADSLFLGAAGETLPDPKDRVEEWNRIQTARLHLRHGRLFEDSGDENRALQEFDEAAALAPGLPDVHVHRGHALMQLGRDGEARSALRRALELDDRFAPAWSALGQLEEKAGRLDEARAAFVRAFEDGKGNSSVLLAVMSFDLRNGDLAGAIRAGERLVQAHPGDATALNDLATLYLSAGKVEESLAACQRALLADSSQPITHYNMGRALVASGRPADAARSFERYLEVMPDAPNADAVRRGIEQLKRQAAGDSGRAS